MSTKKTPPGTGKPTQRRRQKEKLRPPAKDAQKVTFKGNANQTGKGARSKLIPERANQIVALLQGGNTMEASCSMARVGAKTVYAWIEKGKSRPEGDPYREFSDKIASATHFFEAEHLQNIAKAGRDDWRASLALLERKFPARYRVNHDLGTPAQPIQVHHKHESDQPAFVVNLPAIFAIPRGEKPPPTIEENTEGGS